jgi:nitrilase
VPSAATERLAAVARDEGIWLALGANELAGGTLYNSLLVFGPDAGLVVHHRKLMPTNHERLVWGLGDGRGLEAVETDLGRVGGLICWENYMPLARFALYQSGVEVYLAPTADDSESWHESIRYIARESRAFVLSACVFQRASSYPDDVPIAEGPELLGRGGSAILGPDGSYLAGPLWDEEGILYAELDPQRLYEERQRFDPAGHYHRPDVFRLIVS